MSMRLTSAGVLAAVEEAEEALAGGLIGADDGVCGGEVGGLQGVGLPGEGDGGEDGVGGDEGEFVEEEEVGGADGGDGEGGGGGEEGVVGFGAGCFEVAGGFGFEGWAVAELVLGRRGLVGDVREDCGRGGILTGMPFTLRRATSLSRKRRSPACLAAWNFSETSSGRFAGTEISSILFNIVN